MTEILEILALVEKEAPGIFGEVKRLAEPIVSHFSSAAPAGVPGTNPSPESPVAPSLTENMGAEIEALQLQLRIALSQRNNLAVQLLDADFNRQQNQPKAEEPKAEPKQ